MATKSKKPTGEKHRADAVEMIQRIERVKQLASGHEQPTRAELAAEWGVTTRAVSSVIERMQAIGIEIVSQPRPRDGKMGYVVQASDFLKQDLSVAEAVASVLLTQSVLGTPLAPDNNAAAGGVHRITASLGKEVRGKLELLEGRFAVRLLRAAQPHKPEIFRVVLDGILENRVLSMEYESPYKPAKGTRAGGGTANAPGAASAAAVTGDAPAASGVNSAGSLGKARKVETVQIEPWGVFFARRSWYLIARKRPGGEMRQYKIARIKRVTTGSQTFELPRGWTVDGYLKNAWETINSPGAPVKVVVDLSPTVAGNMVETKWHESQEFKPLSDGWVRFTAKVAGLDEIMWWVLGIGSNARVVAPPELRDKVHAEIRRMHAMIEEK